VVVWWVGGWGVGGGGCRMRGGGPGGGGGGNWQLNGGGRCRNEQDNSKPRSPLTIYTILTKGLSEYGLARQKDKKEQDDQNVSGKGKSKGRRGRRTLTPADALNRKICRKATENH